MKTMNNIYNYLYYGIYKVFKRMGIKVPVFLAVMLKSNRLKGISGFVYAKTFDGSDQLCHPSMVKFEGDLWVVATPYPYMYDLFEAPCIYKFDLKNNELISRNDGMPVLSMKHGETGYLSDPCFWIDASQINLLIRKVVFLRENTCEKLIVLNSTNGIEWNESELLMSESYSDFLSPAICDDKLFCVRRNKQGTIVDYYKKPYNVLHKVQTVVNGLDNNEYVWHIDVQRYHEKTIGLFMICKNNHSTVDGSYLAFFCLNENKNEWDCIGDIIIPTKINQEIAGCYKSTFSIEDKILLLCLVKKNRRFFLLRKELILDL